MEERHNACFLDALPTKTEYLETGNKCIGRDSLITPRSGTLTTDEPFYAPRSGGAPPKKKWRNISPERPIPIHLDQYESQRNDPFYSEAIDIALEMGKLVLVDDNQPVEPGRMPQGVRAV